MSEKENLKPYFKGNNVISVSITLLMITFFKDKPEMLDYLIPITKLVTDIVFEWITGRKNNSKTKQ